jgi:hypothetical protein
VTGSRFIALLVLAFALGPAVHAGTEGQADQVIRGGVDLITVDFSVLGRDG